MKTSRWSKDPAAKLAVVTAHDVIETRSLVYLTLKRSRPDGTFERMRIQMTRAEAVELGGRLAVPAINIVYRRRRTK